jgi:hypothetical protein
MSSDPAPNIDNGKLKTMLDAVFATNGVVFVIVGIVLIVLGQLSGGGGGSMPMGPISPTARVGGAIITSGPAGSGDDEGWIPSLPSVSLGMGIVFLVGGVLELVVGLIAAKQATTPDATKLL